VKKTMNLSQQPWVINTHREVNDIRDNLLDISGGDIKESFFILDAKKMNNYDGLYDEFSKVLRFPEYFGRNLNALDECLADLEWLDLNAYIIFIKHSKEFLIEEKKEDVEVLVKIFNKVGEEWSLPVRLGEEWDRDPVPFHVIMQRND